MTLQALEWKRLIARFDPPLSQVRAAKLCGYSGRTGRRWAAGDLGVPKAVEIMIRSCLRRGASIPRICCLGLARGSKGGNGEGHGEGHGLGPQILAHGSSGRSRLDHLGCYG